MAKRRIGLGFLGLGDALVMLGVRYDTQPGRTLAQRIAAALRDTAYATSIDLATEKGPFPLFDERYLHASFVRRLPEPILAQLSIHGIRNSHLISIAPTGTISLAFADNASNGIEPAFSWRYTRRKRDSDGHFTEVAVEDHALRVYRSQHDAGELPAAFVSALDIAALDHARMVAAVQPFVDSAISKTVNIPADYPYEAFRDLYSQAWELGLKSLATFRPNPITGVILSATEAAPPDFATADRRLELPAPAVTALASLRWPRRPVFTDGNPAHCYMVKHPHGRKFALFVGHFEESGRAHPFEVWVNGIEQPRGLNALAINLSYDMYARDRGWLRHKLELLHGCSAEDEGFDLPMPPHGKPRHVPSLVAAMATLIQYRCEQLGAFADIGSTPLLDALMSRDEPRTGPDGTLSWTVDIVNPATGDDFTLGLKELSMNRDTRTQRLPYALWLSGDYPRALDGLCRALSLDMRVIDPAWIGKKLRELLTYAEPKGDFFAAVPGTSRKLVYPSTVAYIATLMIHRYEQLDILDAAGYPRTPAGLIHDPQGMAPTQPLVTVHSRRRCEECGAAALMRVDGCDRCQACGAIGVCG
jgi:ribonucleoside-diphosphate reductase alpha chain